MSKSNHITILAVIYTALLVLSNLTASKVAQISNFHFTAAIIFFPFTYIIDDVLTEVYGFKVSRSVIWLGLVGNLIVLLGAIVIILVPSSSYWYEQNAFKTVFGISFRILLASVSAYIAGEFLNSIILAKLKVKTKGKYFWFRAILGTIIGAAGDTSIFMFVAFLGVLDVEIIFGMILLEYSIKIIIEVLVLPITYKLVEYLKRVDNIDYYDEKTKFKLFSFS